MTSACRHCGQGSLQADYVGPICPDCIEEGYVQFAPTMPIAEIHAITAEAQMLEALYRISKIEQKGSITAGGCVSKMGKIARAAIARATGGAA